MKVKQHEAPEFQVIKMDEANAKFYAASEKPSPNNPAVNGSLGMTYTKTNANGWI